MAESSSRNGALTVALRAALGILLSGLVTLSVWLTTSIADATVQRALQNAAIKVVEKEIGHMEDDCDQRKAAIAAVTLYVATSSKDIEQIKRDLIEVKIRLGKIEDRLPLSVTAMTSPPP